MLDSKSDEEAIREFASGLEAIEPSDIKAERIRRAAHAALASAKDSEKTALGRAWHRAEPLLAVAVAAVYMAMAFRAVLQVY